MEKDLSYISIKIASPEEILKWSHGEVTKPETLNYRTQRPEKDGLFSERIFGPTKDFECYCGKYKKVRHKGVTCEKCGVLVTRSIVRRERMGHINLAVPVSHVWFLRVVPSRLSLLLDVSVTRLEKVIYYAAYIVTNVDESKKLKKLDSLNREFKSFKKEGGANVDAAEERTEKLKTVLSALRPGSVITESEYYMLAEHFGDAFEADRGASALRKILESLDLKALEKSLEKEMEIVTDENRMKRVLRRLGLVRSFLKAKIKPEWLIMTVLPVLPPELRPMVALDGGRFATADLNDLYRRVINRNNRLKRLIELNSPEVIITNEKRMLQEAVDALIDNSVKAGTKILGSRRRPLRSLADMLKGKQGRFRQNLLGKRVDYSGRSVIVVGPELKLDECGLPKNLVLELFRHFVINKLIERGLAYNIKQANRFIEAGSDEVWAILEEVIKHKRVLLNRAPTLHRLGIQAFKPLLIEDLAIRIPPLVCSAFNADFDGDQMAVHLPLTFEAQYEANNLMNAEHNLLKPANGDPITTPSNDIVLGVYFLTRIIPGAIGEGKVFSDFTEIVYAYENGFIDINTQIKTKIRGEFMETSYGRIIFNNIFPLDFPFVNDCLIKKTLSKFIAKLIDRYGIENAHVYIDKIKDLGFYYATVSGITWGMEDTVAPKEKGGILKEGEKKVDVIDSQFNEGLLTAKERKERVIEVWNGVREQVATLVPKGLSADNPVASIINSGSRGSWAQFNQIMGMKGLVSNPQGETIELPVKSSYKDGLKVLEYFIATHGARKGTTDTALKTASAGYLTRRLVDVAQDLVVQEEDCGTKEGIKINRKDGEEFSHSFADRLYSRITLEDIRIDRKVVVKAGEIISREKSLEIQKAPEVESVLLRSPIACESLKGICAACYGLDLSKNKLVGIGEAVGIVAAQSIGEPGTQLTMRTFHVGGVAGVDITHGLPRVEEIFEARTPKGKAPLSKSDGVVEDIENRGQLRIIKIKPDKQTKKQALIEYLAPSYGNILVKVGDRVEKGTILTEGPLDLRELLVYKGIEYLYNYIVGEIQKIYVPEGASINNKHIEIIVRQMLSRVLVKESGGTDYLPGDLISKSEFKEANQRMHKLDKEKAKGIIKVLGVTTVALESPSFLSAASFQQTSRVLVAAACENAVDTLQSLKENVIIGKLIPAGTGKMGIPKDKLAELRSRIEGPQIVDVPEEEVAKSEEKKV